MAAASAPRGGETKEVGDDGDLGDLAGWVAQEFPVYGRADALSHQLPSQYQGHHAWKILVDHPLVVQWSSRLDLEDPQLHDVAGVHGSYVACVRGIDRRFAERIRADTFVFDAVPSGDGAGTYVCEVPSFDSDAYILAAAASIDAVGPFACADPRAMLFDMSLIAGERDMTAATMQRNVYVDAQGRSRGRGTFVAQLHEQVAVRMPCAVIDSPWRICAAKEVATKGREALRPLGEVKGGSVRWFSESISPGRDGELQRTFFSPSLMALFEIIPESRSNVDSEYGTGRDEYSLKDDKERLDAWTSLLETNLLHSPSSGFRGAKERLRLRVENIAQGLSSAEAGGGAAESKARAIVQALRGESDAGAAAVAASPLLRGVQNGLGSAIRVSLTVFYVIP
jgi:hypothetical protein